MKFCKAPLAALALVALTAGTVTAAPITYLGTLSPGVTVTDVNTQAPGNESNPLGADYWMFYAEAGVPITVDGDRLAGHYDMSFWIFTGVYTDTVQFGASFPGLQAGNSIGFYDDETAPNIAGPFGDPFAGFIAPVSGYYTIAVTNFLSSAGPPNPYSLVATGITAVPEPTSMVLLGSGLVGLAGAMRRRMKAKKA